MLFLPGSTAHQGQAVLGQSWPECAGYPRMLTESTRMLQNVSPAYGPPYTALVLPVVHCPCGFLRGIKY